MATGLRELVTGPLPLVVDAFTPLTRTPWAGTYIGESLKDVVCPAAKGQLIGESWELSCDPAFPSRIKDDRRELSELIAAFPDEMLSPAQNARCDGRMEMTIKLLNAARPLSFQVHPADGDPSLAVGECGKPESWLILHRDPGAGVYIGFGRSMSRASLGRHCEQGTLSVDDLQFVPVEPGEYFEIAPGVPHAIGAGVTLLEPQRILPGTSGKTYRLWDWDRKYNAAGQIDDSGLARQLDVAAAIALVDPERQVGAAFAATASRLAVSVSLGQRGVMKVFPQNANYRVFMLETSDESRLNLCLHTGYGAVTVLSGTLTLRGSTGLDVLAAKGQTVFLPFASSPLMIRSSGASRWVLVVPAATDLDLT